MQKGLLAQYGFPIGAALVGIVLYYSGMLPERNAGALLAGAAALLPAPYAGTTLAAIAPPGLPRLAIRAATYAVAVLCVVPVYFAVFPGDAAYQGTVTEQEKTVTIADLAAGPYTLTIDGQLPPSDNEVTADYRLKLVSGDVTKTLDGQLYRRTSQVRVGRRGQATEEHARTYDRHSITLPGGSTEVTLAKSSSALTQGVRFQLHKVYIPALLFWIASVLFFGLGAFLEAKYGTEKTRSLLTTSMSFSVAFTVLFLDQMKPEVVKAAFGSGVVSLFIGITVGGLTSVIVRQFVKSAHAPATPKAKAA